MDLDRLRLFVQVADAGGFSDAARRLGAERSSVSRGVAKLERELGVQLFHRSTRSVALTSAGEALHAKVATHLAALERAIDALPEREEAPSGTLRITAPHDIGASDLSGVIADFVRRFPKVHVDVRVTNRRVDLVAEGFDAALRPGPARLPDSSLRATRLSEATGGWYASPRYVARAGSPRTLAEAAEHEWVRGPAGPLGTVMREPALSVDDMQLVRSLVLHDVGLGFLPDFLARDDVLAGRLLRLPLTAIEAHFVLYLVTPPAEHIPKKLRVFRDYLLEHFRTRPLGR